MAELTALLKAVDQNNEALENVSGELTDLRVEIENLPDKYLSREEAKTKERNLKRGIAVVAITLLFVATVLGTMFYLNHGVTCAVRGILVSAQTSANRNPLPADLTDAQRKYVEDQRKQSRVFFSESLERLNIIWPCAGETTP